VELKEFERLAWILRADTGGFAEERSVDVAAFPVELAGDTDGFPGEFSEDPGSCSGKASADRCCITHPLDKSGNSCPRGLAVETIIVVKRQLRCKGVAVGRVGADNWPKRMLEDDHPPLGSLYFSLREKKISREQLLVRVSRRFSNSFVKQVKDLVACVKWQDNRSPRLQHSPHLANTNLGIL
jgi:hypothetical protein